MSTAEGADGKHHEIVIVRHGHGDHEDGHHGGAWKIAFADFMTAMMCFFLVMWLINASNEQTRAAVASYFNPVKLIDRNASRKGLEDIGDGPQSSGQDEKVAEQNASGTSKAGPSNKEGTADTTSIAKHADEQLFADPYAVLAEIAAETGSQQNISEKGAGGAQSSGPATGASGGEAYRDPFAPDFWAEQVATPSDAEASAEIAKLEPVPEPSLDPVPDAAETEPPKANEHKAEAVEKLETVKADEPKEEKPPAAAKDAAPAQEAKPPEPTPETIKAADEIRSELAKALLPDDKLKDGISVVATDKGVRVSVTDQLEFGMFEIGSAVPRRELVLAMEKISKAIGAQKGSITISGHTDARPFKSANYDNWRLSTARAHSAYYMLVRAGLEERRVTEVGGYADRKLKDVENPLSSSNRRIEILLEIPQ